MPNEQGIDTDWSKFRVSVSEVEKLTGFTFWRNIPQETRDAIVKDVDDVKIPKGKMK
jgi:DNA/RNA endonuclease G (NUC1)